MPAVELLLPGLIAVAGGNVFTIVAGLNAVLLAFVLISQFDAASAAGEDARREADALVGLNWAAGSLAEPTSGRVHALTRSYATTVVEEEWPRLRAAQP